MPRVHVLQHVPFEGLGSIEPWLLARRAEISYTRFFEESWTLPDPADFDLIIAMGGPMSVNDEATLSWLVPEKAFLASAIRQGVRVLGICLGAQLIASALGAAVRPNPVREIGWFELTAEPTPAHSFAFPPVATVFHWHGETFDLPPGAVRLARSAACENQAFQLGEDVIGLQFHLETTPESAAALIEHCADELDATQPYVQSAEALRAMPEAAYASINELMDSVLSHLLPHSTRPQVSP